MKIPALDQVVTPVRDALVAFCRLPSWIIWLTVLALYVGLFVAAWTVGFA